MSTVRNDITYSTGWATANPDLLGKTMNDFVASVPDGAIVEIDISRMGFVTLTWRIV